MMRFILTAILALGATSAFAGELDNESGITNKQLQGTLVLRVDTRTNDSAYVQFDQGLKSESEAKTLAKTATFAKVPSNKVRSELDQDGGASSWYFYGNYNNGYGSPYGYPYYTPVCNYYGNSYNPYYSYNYGNYNYYYYGSYWSYGR